MRKRGKKYREAAKLVDRQKLYTPEEAVSLAKEAQYVKFDGTLEAHLRMNLDPRKSDQQVRGVALLPNGLGKTVRILVFTQGEGMRVAEEAGADIVGGDELVQRIEGGWTDFDVALATPEMMPKIGKLGRILGRRGLMPNPKSGTVAMTPADLPRLIRDARKGRVEFRLDRTGIIHVPLGKMSFEDNQLVENLGALMGAVLQARPSGAKGQYIKSVAVASTMGPGIRLDLNAAEALGGTAA